MNDLRRRLIFYLGDVLKLISVIIFPFVVFHILEIKSVDTGTFDTKKREQLKTPKVNSLNDF